MKWIITVTFCAILVVIHLVAIAIIFRKKKFLVNRFVRLVLYLSISDVVMLTEYIAMTTLFQIKYENYNGIDNNACIVLKYVIAGTIQFSMLQILLICFERLNATFVQPKVILKIVTGNTSLVVLLLVTHGLAAYYAIYKVNYGRKNGDPVGCDPSYSMQRNFILKADSAGIILLTLIATFYVITTIRILKRYSKVNINVNNIQLQHRKTMLKKNILTLTLIVMVTLCSLIPRTSYGVYILVNGFSTSSHAIIRGMNNLLLLNPLFDPFIYVYRIKHLRKIVYICKRCCYCRSSRVHAIDQTKNVELRRF